MNDTFETKIGSIAVKVTCLEGDKFIYQIDDGDLYVDRAVLVWFNEATKTWVWKGPLENQVFPFSGDGADFLVRAFKDFIAEKALVGTDI